ncbi:MAG: riboflavin biosynthesis protein RibF [Alphaproteobacteria bacterium]|jgi:riboflavin kinase / FMN adenylyltransferase|nr:riboflavin biosynthesis protein RibF [Rhodospirillaceae bacterium]MBT6512470.1 riboflavin biosynthesis protein RibF [Rhodospirillaceae bacterium]MBT7614684.1 riboflavin biosynthesis protein RibF [Rhodospirillaceae bacterium]MBT7645486.1 riboflavin biosynthesis protein RibF [Rhodospirillaceae bacterium]MDG2479420.1 riboflavin biosynthesis protein RibF [Alphaproteobacteria bacterium]
MRILRHPVPTPEALRGAVVALGNFDGVHRGHRSVIEHARALAGDAGAPCGVVTFEPHPRSFFQGAGAPFRLTPFRQKARLMAGLGLDLMANFTFDPALAGHLAQDFVATHLLRGLGVSHVVTGPGFVFGKGRRGNGTVLARMAEMEQFGYSQAPIYAHRGTKVSSTDIRVLLRRGQVDQVAEHLGHVWEFEGRVQAGEQRGREMGFPTANQALDGLLHPGPGIYAVRAGIVDGKTTTWHDAAAYVGTRPTFAGETVLLETNLFDFSGDLYGKRLRVCFVERVRKDMTFRGMDALAIQMQEDCDKARVVLAGLKGRSPQACGTVPEKA